MYVEAQWKNQPTDSGSFASLECDYYWARLGFDGGSKWTLTIRASMDAR